MSVLLKGEEGNEFELAFVEERIAESQEPAAERGYLTLWFRVGTEDAAWEESSPCMNTYEIKNLAQWLDALAAEQPDMGELELLEPELKFSVIRREADGVTLRIAFHLEARPEEFQVDAPTDEARWIDLRLGRDQVQSAAAELRGELNEVSAREGRSLFEEDDLGVTGLPDEMLNLIDRVEEEPEGMGPGEENAEER